ncbi:MAG: nucleotidyltransferase domain-containing protein [Bacteroidaceae bacterium]|nr:nucleotidyltransferase domain-containing protein [Bacteroidaceae bacterium]MBR1789960.1 nucleotidyltransferase domain-containing protein [Bacteroidaceae bacterium]
MSNQALAHKIADYFKTKPVLKAWLFGSVARGEESSTSDVDILVSLDYSQPIGLKYFGMVLDLENLLGRPVDLVEEGQLMPFARQDAERDKKLIYERASS